MAQVDITALFDAVRTVVLNGFCPSCGFPFNEPVREGEVVVCKACGYSYTAKRVLSDEGKAALEKMVEHVLRRFVEEHARPLAEDVKAWLAAQLRNYAELVLEEVRVLHDRLGEMPTKEDLEEGLRGLHEAIVAHLTKLGEEFRAQRSDLISVKKELETVEGAVSFLGEEIRREIYVIKVMLEDLVQLLRERKLGLIPEGLTVKKPMVFLAYKDMWGRRRIIPVQEGMIIGRSGLDVVIRDAHGKVVRKLGVQDICVSRVHALLMPSGGKLKVRVLTERKSGTKIGLKVGDRVVEEVVQKGTYTLEDGQVLTLGFTRFEVICCG